MIAQALLLVALAGPPARAAAVQPQAQPKVLPRRPVRVLPGVDVELKTKDGWTLAARYSAPKDPALPVFILLHEVGGRKENWYFLARAMAKKGIGYLALDFRGHGGSQSPPPGQPEHWRKFPNPTRLHGEVNEWGEMTKDVDAAAEYLQSQKVEVSSIALGGADVGSSIALKWAAVHPAAPMVFMLSPGMSYHEVLTVNAMRVYNKRPILMVVGADDNHSTRETAILFEFAKRAAGPENTLLLTAEREHGTRILAVNRGIIGKILDWIENPLAATAAAQAPQASTAPVAGSPLDGVPAPLPSDGELTPASTPPAEGGEQEPPSSDSSQ
ncbi:MAG: alpha/beta fold hydrolase [Elusimicrobia bacterium]|nr:alpha/beta fold hydrolase [Elusimicrobiota bacterium]